MVHLAPEESSGTGKTALAEEPGRSGETDADRTRSDTDPRCTPRSVLDKLSRRGLR